MSEQERLTPERLAELRRIAEAADFLKRLGASNETLQKFYDEFNPPTALAMVAEIEHLRQERAQAASLIRSAIEWIYDEETGEWAWDDSDYRHALEELRQAIDLLCPEKGGGDDE